MKKLDVLKAGIEIAVSIGVGAIVGNAIKATTPETTRGLSKLIVGLGALVLTGIASDMAAKYTEARIDETLGSLNSLLREDEIEISEEAEESL